MDSVSRLLHRFEGSAAVARVSLVTALLAMLWSLVWAMDLSVAVLRGKPSLFGLRRLLTEIEDEGSPTAFQANDERGSLGHRSWGIQQSQQKELQSQYDLLRSYELRANRDSDSSHFFANWHCLWGVTAISGRDGDSPPKWGCGVEHFRAQQHGDCIVYSFVHSANGRGLEFEDGIIDSLPRCTLHLFEGTAPSAPTEGTRELPPRFAERAEVHRLPLGEESVSLLDIMATLNHSHLDIVSVDSTGPPLSALFAPDAQGRWPSIGQMIVELEGEQQPMIELLESHSLRLFHVANGNGPSTFSFIQREWNPNRRRFGGALGADSAEEATTTALDVSMDAAFQRIGSGPLIPVQSTKTAEHPPPTKKPDADFLSFVAGAASRRPLSAEPDGSEPVEWWNDDRINTEYKEQFESAIHRLYLEEFDALKHDVLSVRTQIGDERVEFRMYAPRRTARTDDIVTAAIRRDHEWERGDNKYFQQRPHCQDTASCGLFVDIGANIGYWSLFMAHLGFDVVSFEAMTSNSLMLYATIQELVSPAIRDRIRLFPVALSNVSRESTVECIVCSHDTNTQDGILECGHSPSCDTRWGGYSERETVRVLNLKHFLDDMFPALARGGNLRAISNLKIDVEGHEPEVLWPILDLFQRGLIDKMFAECFGNEQSLAFFETQIGPRMQVLNPEDLPNCRHNIINLKYQRFPRAESVRSGLEAEFEYIRSRRLLSFESSPSTKPTASKLKYFRFSRDGTDDRLSMSDEMKRFQAQREAHTASIFVRGFGGALLFAHHSPREDVHISGALSRGSLFEEDAVVAIAKHIELILSKHSGRGPVSFIDIGANIGMYTVGVGGWLLDRVPSLDIFAFEPSQDNIALLSSSLRQNKLSNVLLFPYGLSESGNLGDTVSFVIDSKNKGHSHVEGDHSWSENDGETVRVETVPLDTFSEILKEQQPERHQSWSNALWLKMDTEGLEPFIIRGGRQSLFSNNEMAPCFIKLEFARHREQIVALLMAAGYNMVDFDWESIAQRRAYSRTQAIHRQNWDAIFAKTDAEQCALRKIHSPSPGDSGPIASPSKPSVVITSADEQRVFSQNGEDGVIQSIFDRIGVTDRFYIEFGTENGAQSNTRRLREHRGWNGLLMDGGHDIPSINLHRERIHHSNVGHLFRKYHVPKAFDLLSTDTDFKDFWISRAILIDGYRPRVIVSEINASFEKRLALTVPRDIEQDRWSGTYYFGATPMAMTLLYRKYGYSLVYCESRGVNCFWVRNELLDESDVARLNEEEHTLETVRCAHYASNHGAHPTDLSPTNWWQEIVAAPGTKQYEIRRFTQSNVELDRLRCR